MCYMFQNNVLLCICANAYYTNLPNEVIYEADLGIGIINYTLRYQKDTAALLAYAAYTNRVTYYKTMSK